MRKLLFVIVLFLVSCAPKIQPEMKIVTHAVVSSTPTVLIASVPAVTSAVTLVATVTNTPIPSESLRGTNYVGYWLKVVKNEDSDVSWSMELYYQDEKSLTFITSFCVRGSDTNTKNGFYFLAEDRAARFSVNGDYVSSDHNYLYIFAKENWYVHPAPWNNQGVDGCPTKSSSGCINMRQEDLSILIFGGAYRNPFRGETVMVPTIRTGTPLVIVDDNLACLWLGQCMQVAACVSGWDCFQKYTCQNCTEADTKTKWAEILRSNSNIEMLEIQK